MCTAMCYKSCWRKASPAMVSEYAIECLLRIIARTGCAIPPEHCVYSKLATSAYRARGRVRLAPKLGKLSKLLVDVSSHLCVSHILLYGPHIDSTAVQSARSQSEESGRTRGPSLLGGLAILFVYFCVLIPAFPMLFGLAFLPPKTWRFKWLSGFAAVYVAVALTLIFLKRATYMADYYQERSKPRQSRFERFEHLRTNDAGDQNRADK
jgi:hypothetical protein